MWGSFDKGLKRPKDDPFRSASKLGGRRSVYEHVSFVEM